MKVLVVGAGGREHALVRALARSPQRPELWCAPGNAGIRADARLLKANPDDAEAFAAAAAHECFGLVVVGPEAPLVDGLADALGARGLPCFGPSAAAARLEGSKAHAKAVMRAAGIPTAAHTTVTTPAEGLHAITRYPVVLKADGLAAGKGVVIAGSEPEARAALEEMLVRRRFGPQPVVVEEHLTGEEVSLLALCDGERAVPLVPARDFKRARDGDEGPNTGGMGAFSPVPGVTTEEVHALVGTIHQPVVEELARRGTPFHGVLYAGLMLTPDGPRVLEFNVRFGDPETQAVLPRLRSDLLALLLAATRPGGLKDSRLEWDPRWAVSVVLAARGYPEDPQTGDPITGLERVPAEVEVSHAGTAERDGAIVTAGGRVLCVTALGTSPRAARRVAYAAADAIAFEGKQLRHDIAAEVAMSTSETPFIEDPEEPVPGVAELVEPPPEPGRIESPETAPEAVVASVLQEELGSLEVDAPRVGILMGSQSDMDKMDAAARELEQRDILHEVRVMSAHRDPDMVADYAKNAQMRGLRVIIAGAGLAAALPGVVAAHTELPVIGVPLSSSKSIGNGLDALLAISQMPPGVPVACVGVDSARNAAILAARILQA